MISSHTRFESPGSASTILAFIQRAKELGRSHIAYTDTGRVTSLFKAYKEAKSKGIKLIPGCEIQFRLPESYGLPFSYYTATAYCKDQAAYQALGHLLSNPVAIRETESEHEIPLFDIEQIKSLKGQNIGFSFHGLNSVAGKLLLANKADVLNEILEVFERISSDISVSLIAAKEDEIIVEKMEITIQDLPIVLSTNDRLDLDTVKDGKFKRISILAGELLNNDGYKKTISAIYPNGVKISLIPSVPSKVRSVKVHEKHASGCVNALANKALLELSKQKSLKVLVSDNAYMDCAKSKGVQDAKLQGDRLETDSLFMLTDDELIQRFLDQGFNLNQIQAWIKNTEEWAQAFNEFKMDYEWRLPKLVDDEQQFIKDLINKVGRMKWDDPKYADRLNYEMSIIRDNGVFDFSPYFIPIASVFEEYRSHGLITGPGRGSLASSLLAYVMGFTHINPFDYDLDFNRFFSMDRVKTRKIPDADCDLQSRELLVGTDGGGGLLKKMMGDKYAQISTRGNLRLKSSIQYVARSFNEGVVPPEITKISNNLPTPPQGTSDKDYVFGYTDSEGTHHPGLIDVDESLQEYAQKYPEQWAVVSEMLGVSNSLGRHASAFVLTDIPVSHLVPTMTVRGHGPVTQYEAKEVEAAGLIKYDFLVVNQLKDIQGCLDLINKKDQFKDEAGYFLHQGKRTFIWDLPQNDHGVSEIVASGNYVTAFQVSTATATPLVQQIQPTNVTDFAVILALGRPGPLDFIDESTGRNMAEEYIWRRQGKSESHIPGLKKSLPDTFGSIVYQEDLAKIAKTIGKMSGERAEILRDHMCKKREKAMLEMKPEFMAGAINEVGEKDAEEIWAQMKTFANYGFAKPHAVSYATITYATFFLRAHYPLEWWASVLKNADSKEIKEKFWKHVKYLVTPPDINLSEEEMLIDYKSGTIRNKLSVLKGFSEAGVNKLVQGRPYKTLQDLVDSRHVGDSMLKKMMHVGILDSLLAERNLTLVSKMTHLEDAFNQRDFKTKMSELAGKELDYKEGRRKTKPKPPTPPEPALPDVAYLTMSPYEDAVIKKTVMPSVEIDITSVIQKASPHVRKKIGKVIITNPKGKENVLLSGDEIKALDDPNYQSKEEVLYYACGGIVLSMKEFLFNKNESRALKMLVDTDGYEREVVLWPDYETKQLSYPENLKEGSVITIFYSRRFDKQKSYLNDIRVEFSPKTIDKKKKSATI